MKTGKDFYAEQLQSLDAVTKRATARIIKVLPRKKKKAFKKQHPKVFQKK